MKESYVPAKFSLVLKIDQADETVIRKLETVICVDCITKPYKDKIIENLERSLYPGVDGTYNKP